ncbi:MAG: MotA/TolQ/ExbB proton channel family protein [Hydrogenobaculum sp.]
MHISSELSRGMWLLDTSITAAPLIGLLGTVVGMIKAFGIIGSSGIVAPKEVTGGVAEAFFHSYGAFGGYRGSFWIQLFIEKYSFYFG